jgi:hypothetical protein
MEPIIHPAPHESEFPVDTRLRSIQQLCGLFRCKSKEESKFDHPAFSPVQIFQLHENAIEIHDLDTFRIDPGQIFMEWHWNSTVALQSPLRASVIHQHTPHEPRGKTVEVFAVFKPETALANHLEE